jgi:SAM-dependent methyltransferase
MELSMAAIPQTSRATLDFLAGLGAYGATTLYGAAEAYFNAHTSTTSTPIDLDDRLRAAQEVIGKCGEYRYNRLIQKMTAEQWQPLTYMTRERLRLEGALADSEPPEGGGTVELDPALELPEYFTGVTFHNLPRDMFFVTTGPPAHPHSQKVLDRAGCAAVRPGSDLLEHRRRTAAQTQRATYARILDVGCGHGTWTATLQRRFPGAAIYAIDLWPGAIEATRRIAAAGGWQWHLKQAAGEDTGYPDDFFNLAASYAVLHEVPAHIAEAILREMFRVLAPGGDLLFMDVPPYREVSDFQLLLYDWETEHRAEPYLREEGKLNRGELCRRIGFDDVYEYGIGDEGYPWVLRARKPASLQEELK